MEYNWHKGIVQCLKKNLIFFNSDFIKLFLYHASSLILGQKNPNHSAQGIQPRNEVLYSFYLSARLKQMAEILVQIIWYCHGPV